LYKFEQYGIPQSRHRYIIVGIRNDLGFKFDVPAPTHGRDIAPFVTTSQALEKIKSAKTNCELTRQKNTVVMRLKFTPPWHNAWYLDDLLSMTADERRRTLRNKLPWYTKEFSHLSDSELLEKLKWARLNCKKARMSHIYKRLHPDKPSYTITGSGGGGTHVYHWLEHRALTNRERAKLQSFPNSFEFQGSKEEVRKQIGMAVPPKGARIIFKAILKKFAGVQYDSIPPSLDLESKNIFERLMALSKEEKE
jgi:DNA (cytosine-5)-methyltransferase 1